MLELLLKRRSIREYKQKAIKKGKIEKLIQAALLSPSSRRLNPWEFIVIDDKELLNRLSKAKEHGSSFLQNASFAIVVIADTGKSDVWIEDCSIASIIIQLMAESLELSSCWVQIRNRNHNKKSTSGVYVKRLLGIPQKYNVESIVAIGYPDESKSSHSLEDLQYDKIYYNAYNSKFFLRVQDGENKIRSLGAFGSFY